MFERGGAACFGSKKSTVPAGNGGCKPRRHIVLPSSVLVGADDYLHYKMALIKHYESRDRLKWYPVVVPVLQFKKGNGNSNNIMMLLLQDGQNMFLVC